MIKIFLTNLGKYNEGHLIGKWVELPVDSFTPILKEIGINEQYEEYFISDYETDIKGLKIEEYEDLKKLNKFAEECEDFDEWDLAKLGAMLKAGNYNKYDEDFFDMVQDCVIFNNCHTMEDVAYEVVEALGFFEELEKDSWAREVMERYFNYEAYGRDLEIERTYVYMGNGIYVELPDY